MGGAATGLAAHHRKRPAALNIAVNGMRGIVKGDVLGFSVDPQRTNATTDRTRAPGQVFGLARKRPAHRPAVAAALKLKCVCVVGSGYAHPPRLHRSGLRGTVDFLDQTRVELQTCGKHLQIGLLGGCIGFNGDQARSVNLCSRFRAARASHDGIDV